MDLGRSHTQKPHHLRSSHWMVVHTHKTPTPFGVASGWSLTHTKPPPPSKQPLDGHSHTKKTHHFQSRNWMVVHTHTQIPTTFGVASGWLLTHKKPTPFGAASGRSHNNKNPTTFTVACGWLLTHTQKPHPLRSSQWSLTQQQKTHHFRSSQWSLTHTKNPPLSQ